MAKKTTKTTSTSKSLERRLKKLETEMKRQKCLHKPSHKHMGGKSKKSCSVKKKGKK